MSLKRFEIQEMVAKGGMAEVYRAKTVGLQGFEKEVCVKKILPHLTEDESFVNMFINEAKLAATLTYANIVSVHDLCVSAGGEYFIVMEYVHGKDLSDIIRAAQLAGREIPPEVAVYICREACKGLHYAHTKTDATGAPLNIIHRDISPHNVLVSFMGEVKITDFGIAKASSIVNKTAVGILKGKYGYMSPEQARGQPLDHRSDIFNTGIVLYEMLVGERCFAGSSDFSTLNLMRNATVTPPSKINTSIPKDLEAIVLRALSADRNDRYSDALALEAALAKFAEARGKRAHAVELAGFMQQLFSSTDGQKGSNQTGLLSLASIVGPAAQPSEKAAREPKVRRATERAAELADQPISAPNEPPSDVTPNRRPRVRGDKAAADARPEKKEEAGKVAPAMGPTAALDQVAEVAQPNAKDVSAKGEQVEAKPERRPAKGKPAEAAGEPAPSPAKAEKAEKAEELEKAEKPDKGGEKTPEKGEKKGKQLSATPKKPVGRRDLRPGLTMIQQLQRPQRRQSIKRTAALFVAAGIAGAVAGWLQRGTASRQATFREMELSAPDTPGAHKPTTTLLVTSEPPGATVRFDKIELSGKTPLAIERDRDEAEHKIEVTLEGYHPFKKTLRYEAGALNRITAHLSGADGTLKIASKPAGLKVKVDGKDVVGGVSPMTMTLPAGRHEVELSDANHEPSKSQVDVLPNKTVTIAKQVAPKGPSALLAIDSDPQALIFLDDQPTGRWTNDGALPLDPEVSHHIGLQVRENEPRHEVVVKLKKGERKEMFVDLTGSS